VRIPAASRVFMRHDIDFCCGGNRKLTDACAEKGLDAAALLDEIRAELAEEGDVRWDERPLPELIDHILETYHRPLDEELPRLGRMTAKVLAVHGDKDPERLAELHAVYGAVAQELTDHMMKEERVLFPWILSGNGQTAHGPIHVMHAEHDSVALALARIRELTDNFTPPQGACNTWRALWLGLHQFDHDLRAHIHLENNVLFPRALAE
jgi:regulator of cell morphogenesis and NO signaling